MKHFSKKFTILFLCVILSFVGNQLFAKVDPGIFATLKARLIGPANMSGRISDIDAVQKNRNIVYAGTAT